MSRKVVTMGVKYTLNWNEGIPWYIFHGPETNRENNGIKEVDRREEGKNE